MSNTTSTTYKIIENPSFTSNIHNSNSVPLLIQTRIEFKYVSPKQTPDDFPRTIKEIFSHDSFIKKNELFNLSINDNAKNASTVRKLYRCEAQNLPYYGSRRRYPADPPPCDRRKPIKVETLFPLFTSLTEFTLLPFSGVTGSKTRSIRT